MKKKIVIVGGGTAGWIAASYFKSAFQELVDITIIYDHQNPAIGVGESTTPGIIDYLNAVGISYKELIKHTGATIKLGVKFTNWHNDDTDYYHNFMSPVNVSQEILDINLLIAHEISNMLDTGSETHSRQLCDNNTVPITESNDIYGYFALHIDSLKFSEFIRSKFESQITIVDDIITEVNTKDGNIVSIIGKSSGLITADLYVDASGLAQILMPHLENSFESRKDLVFADSAYTCSVPNTTNIPSYTEAVATPNGWIWKTPLQSRIGTGYVYSSKFMSDESAKEDFKNYISKTYGIVNPEISKTPIKFKPGYWKEQWKGNCLTIGLSSGFVEPLEATAIQMIITQVRTFSGNWELSSTEWSRTVYNKLINNMYDQTFDIIRLHYHTNRHDSDMWKEYKNTTPTWLTNYVEKCKNGIITSFDIYHNWDRILGVTMFGLTSWSRISKGLLLFTPESVKRWLDVSNTTDLAAQAHEFAENQKLKNPHSIISHDTFLKIVKDS
jgi:hypothetical protein